MLQHVYIAPYENYASILFVSRALHGRSDKQNTCLTGTLVASTAVDFDATLYSLGGATDCTHSTRPYRH